jgi:hypothetical protein
VLVARKGRSRCAGNCRGDENDRNDALHRSSSRFFKGRRNPRLVGDQGALRSAKGPRLMVAAADSDQENGRLETGGQSL